VRELSNLLERLLILHGNQIVDLVDLPIKYRYFDAQGDALEKIELTENQTQLAERDALCDIFSDSDVISDAASEMALTLPLKWRVMMCLLEIQLLF